MSAYINIPAGARALAIIRGTVSGEGENHGKPARIEHWAGMYSQGYKSNYEAVPTQWVVVRVAGTRPWCKRYTGKRLALAAQEVAACRALIQEEA